jgi:zinc D-Ala-D-Ala carboxypeptidase
MNLSANFTLKELTKSDTATRLGLDNTPDDAALENLKLCAKRCFSLFVTTLASLLL